MLSFYECLWYCRMEAWVCWQSPCHYEVRASLRTDLIEEKAEMWESHVYLDCGFSHTWSQSELYLGVSVIQNNSFFINHCKLNFLLPAYLWYVWDGVFWLKIYHELFICKHSVNTWKVLGPVLKCWVFSGEQDSKVQLLWLFHAIGGWQMLTEWENK